MPFNIKYLLHKYHTLAAHAIIRIVRVIIVLDSIKKLV
jgi:hypothetical protein